VESYDLITLYRIYNPDGVNYIGSTSRNLSTRFIEHIYQAKNRSYGIRDLLKGYKKEELKVIVLEACDIKYRYDRENFYIKKYKNNVNRCLAGPGPIGIRLKKHQIEKARETMNSLWKNRRSFILKKVNAHKTKEFQSAASKVGHANKYRNMPIKLLINRKNNKILLKYKTYKELALYFKINKTTASRIESNKRHYMHNIYEFRGINLSQL